MGQTNKKAHSHMQVVYHLGVHCTDEDRLLKCLLKNKGVLSKQGVVVPGPSRFRNVLRDTLHSLRGGPASAEMQEAMLDAMMDEDQARRLVISRQGFLAAPEKALDMNLFYSDAGEKVAALANLFPQAETEFFIAVRNPATFIPALFSRSNEKDFKGFVTGIDLHSLRWSEMIARIHAAVPHAGLTVWCNEDTPLIWTEILHELAGCTPDTTLEGAYDFLGTIMTRGGMQRMLSYMETHPPQNEMQRRRVVAAFLDKFALDDEVEIELDVPGWTEALVEELTEAYEEDCFAIERMEGVRFLSP